MALEEKFGSVKRFGPRYGTKLKNRYGKIEAEQRKLHKCPYCNQIRVKRVAAGIWRCRKCKSKFVGKAYTIADKIKLVEESQKVPETEASEEESQETESPEAETTKEEPVQQEVPQ